MCTVLPVLTSLKISLKPIGMTFTGGQSQGKGDNVRDIDTDLSRK